MTKYRGKPPPVTPKEKTVGAVSTHGGVGGLFSIQLHPLEHFKKPWLQISAMYKYLSCIKPEAANIF